MWLYVIESGRLYADDGELVGVGYSGNPAHKNDVTAVALHNQGPAPEGLYTIGPPVNTMMHGPYVLPLSPDPKNDMHGRYGIMIHGDSRVDPGTASEGCLIFSPDVRHKVWESGDHAIEIRASLEEHNATT